MALQDSKFTDVDAVSLFWSMDALVITDGLTFSNVSTEAVEWDATGDDGGDGDAGRVVLDFNDGEEVQELPNSILPELTSGHIPQLQPDDDWFEAVKQVCTWQRMQTC